MIKKLVWLWYFIEESMAQEEIKRAKDRLKKKRLKQQVNGMKYEKSKWRK
jgi:hypothetical protein